MKTIAIIDDDLHIGDMIEEVLRREGYGVIRAFSDTAADIFDQINITKLVMALAEESCEVISAYEKDESLESYFISLVGGESHE